MSEPAAKYLSIRELRPRLPSVLRDVASTYARYVVTRRGKPEAVLLSIDDYERLLETVAVESDPVLMRRIRRAEQAFKRGARGKSLEQIHREMGLV